MPTSEGPIHNDAVLPGQMPTGVAPPCARQRRLYRAVLDNALAALDGQGLYTRSGSNARKDQVMTRAHARDEVLAWLRGGEAPIPYLICCQHLGIPDPDALARYLIVRYTHVDWAANP